MVHQHFMLIPVMTVAENIVLANEPTREGFFFDREAAEKRVAELSSRTSWPSTPRRRCRTSASARSSGSRS